jgi:hypothetical protein
MRRVLTGVLLLLPLVAASAACDDASTTPTTPTTPTTTTETFSGRITVNGAATHNFYSTSTGTVTATLTQLVPESTAKIGLAMGTWNGSTCAIVLANDQAVRTSIVTGTVSTVGGSLCVRIYDVGAMSEPTDYEITVVHP